MTKRKFFKNTGTKCDYEDQLRKYAKTKDYTISVTIFSSIIMLIVLVFVYLGLDEY